jgi:hypothetical protein
MGSSQNKKTGPEALSLMIISDSVDDHRQGASVVLGALSKRVVSIRVRVAVVVRNMGRAV